MKGKLPRIASLVLLLSLVIPILTPPAEAAPPRQSPNCLYFTETAGGQGGFYVCDDATARFRTAFQRWGLQKIGYPISRRYMHDGFVTQAFQKAIMQWRPETGTVALINVFDDLHRAGFDDRLRVIRQTPNQFPPGWDGNLAWPDVIKKRQGLLSARPALSRVYFSSSDPLTFFGLPTSDINDMGNHYAIRLQRAVLQEWKETVPWARAGEVTIANGGDIAKELGALPAAALVPESGSPSAVVPGSSSGSSPAPAAPQPVPAPPPSPSASSVFGVEVAGSVGPVLITKAREAGVKWVRLNVVRWFAVEPTPGARAWEQARADAHIQAVSAQGLTPVVVIRGTPAWARQTPGHPDCAPIRQDALDDFANFVRDVVTRYSQPPFNVHHWELGNEPDVDPLLAPRSNGFGCWGNPADPYYGGGYYAEMLKHAYPAIKAVDPSAQVLLGGLLLDCDPTAPPADKNCDSGRFLEGVLRNGGGNYFDILGYHAYGYYVRPGYDSDHFHYAWKHRGGLLLGKLNFVREVMARYGVNKPVFMNEGGLICTQDGTTCTSREYRMAQANAAIRLYTRGWANGLMGATWFTLNGPGWREGGLLEGNLASRPAYQAISFLARQLNGGTYTGAISQSGIEGYRFRRGNLEYHVLWTNEPTTVSYSLPAGVEAVYDMLGQPVIWSGGTLSVGFEPLIIQSR